MVFLKENKLVAGPLPAVIGHSHPLPAEAIHIVAATAQQPQPGAWCLLSRRRRRCRCCHGLQGWWQPAGLP
jgi:hypothetical protein